MDLNPLPGGLTGRRRQSLSPCPAPSLLARPAVSVGLRRNLVLPEVVELAGLASLDPGVHLGAGEEHGAGLAITAVAHGDPAVGQRGGFHADPLITAEAGLAPRCGVQLVRPALRPVAGHAFSSAT